MSEIDNLEIRVTSSADDATNHINTLASAMERFKGSSRSASSSVKDLTSNVKEDTMVTKEAGTETGKAEKRLREFGKSAKDAGEAAKKGSSGLATFWQSLKRIAYYRFIRSIIKEITSAFKEGITNLYHWSDAVNGHFSKSMDRIASSTLYLKNSLGAMLAPIIERLTPVLEWIIDKIVDVINWINKLFAALSGSQTYTIAKKVATKWDDTSKDVASNTKKASDDIKRTILGFDEINKLQKDMSASGNNGSSKSKNTIDYSNMFEERKLDGWMAKLSAFINKFNLGVPAILGSIAAAWATIKAGVNATVKATKKWLKELGQKINIAVGLVRVGWKTIKDWALSFGPAIVSLSVIIATKAKKLYESFKAQWDYISGKVLGVSLAIATKAINAWNVFKTAWDSIPGKVLMFSVAIATKLIVLWNAIKTAWGVITGKVLYVSAAIKTKAITLWNALKMAWGMITGKVLSVYAAIKTKVINLWNSLRIAWDMIKGKVLGVSVAIKTKAVTLWNALKSAWNMIAGKVLTVSVAIKTTVVNLWESFKRSWNALTGKVLAISVAIAITAVNLWKAFKRSWDSVPDKIVSVGLSLVKSGWTSIKQWFQDNKETISDWALGIGAVTLGIALAIATPWETIAAALGGLWSSVMGSFGGSLAFGVMPTFGTTPDYNKKTFVENNGGGVLGHYDDNGMFVYEDGYVHSGGVGRKDVLGSVGAGRKDVLANRGNILPSPKQLEEMGYLQSLNEFSNKTKSILGELVIASKQTMIDFNNNIKEGQENTLGISFEPTGTNITSTMKRGIDLNWNTVIGSITNLINDMYRKADEKSFTPIGVGITSDVDSGVNRGWFSTISLVGSLASAIFNSLGSVSFFDIGDGVIGGIAKGLHAGWSWLTGIVWDLAMSLFNTAKRVLGIGSPSKVFANGIGKMIDLGLVEGIDGSKSLAVKSITDIGKAMSGEMDNFNTSIDVSRLMNTANKMLGTSAFASGYSYGSEQGYEQGNVERSIDGQNEILRDVRELLRQLNEKEFTAEVTSSSVQRAMNRTNRRAGVTVMAVGPT